MRDKAITRRFFCFLTTAIILLLAPVAQAKILIDFGNNVSYRSASTGNPDVNGNYWNSVDSSKYWSNLLNADNSSSLIGFGFSSAPGADSYNGPAGATTGSNNVANVVINVTALGDFGVYPAAFDYYVSSTFTIQQLNSAKVYDLTFFGSHKYNDDNTTVYTVYTANDYATAVASASLLVGVGSAHNQDKVVTISNVAPQTSNSIWIGFKGSAGNNGYLNAMRINEITPDGTWNGGGANSDTMTDANWTNGRYPAAVASGVMRFAGSTRTSPIVNYSAGSAFGSIYFNSGAAAFTVGGNALTLKSLIENDSASAQTINNNLTMGAAISLKSTVAGGSLTLGGTLNTGSGGYTLTADNAYDIAIDGAISGNGSILKSSAGTLILSVANTYSGATTVNAGTLRVNGSLAAGSAVAVNFGGTLGGSGTVGGATTVNAGGALDPGTTSIGTLTTANLTLNNDSEIICKITTPDCDTVQVAGNLSLPSAAGEATTIVIPAGSTLAPNTTYPVVNYTGSLSGNKIAVVNDASELGVTANIDTGNKKILVQTAPEPGLFTLAGLLLLALRKS